jgi:hypothetical protein
MTLGHALWHGSSLAKESKNWLVHLTDEDVREVEQNLFRVSESGCQTGKCMSDDPADFPLANFAQKLSRVATELKDGLGFSVLRGLPVNRYGRDEAEFIFRGIASHLGVCVSQNYKGDLIGQVVDRSDEISDPRRYEAGGEFRMHVDPIDVVGLMCIRKAKRGGDSQIVSALAVHNLLLLERPDLLQALYDGYILFRPYPDRGETDALTPQKVPFFAPDKNGDFAAYFLPDPAIQAVERAGVKLTSLEKEALDYAEKVAARTDLVLNMQLIPGDIQFLNNRKILHSRATYEDFQQKECRRLMLRIWLMIPQWSRLASAQRFFDDADKLGGGIVPQASGACLKGNTFKQTDGVSR